MKFEMLKVIVIFLQLGLSLSLPTPNSRTFFSGIVDTSDPNLQCPYLRKSLELTETPEYLRNCSDLSSVNAQTDFHGKTTDALCLIYYSR